MPQHQSQLKSFSCFFVSGTKKEGREDPDPGIRIFTFFKLSSFYMLFSPKPSKFVSMATT